MPLLCKPVITGQCFFSWTSTIHSLIFLSNLNFPCNGMAAILAMPLFSMISQCCSNSTCDLTMHILCHQYHAAFAIHIVGLHWLIYLWTVYFLYQFYFVISDKVHAWKKQDKSITHNIKINKKHMKHNVSHKQLFDGQKHPRCVKLYIFSMCSFDFIFAMNYTHRRYKRYQTSRVIYCLKRIPINSKRSHCKCDKHKISLQYTSETNYIYMVVL